MTGDRIGRAGTGRPNGEGKGARDVRRCLNRVVVRQLFKLVERDDRPGVQIVAAA
jgi:hypothetical protein